METGIYGFMLLVSFLFEYVYGVFFIIFLMFICYLSRTFLLFLIPLFMYVLMVTFLHWNIYHAGILAGFFVFILWQIYADSKALLNINIYFRSKFSNMLSFRIAEGTFYCVIAIILAINLYWSYSASMLEVKNNYDISRSVAAYIKKGNLYDRVFWVPPSALDKYGNYMMIGSYAINAYFDKNMIQDLNGGNGEISYLEYKRLVKDKVYVHLKTFGEPEFILANAEKDLDFLKDIFDVRTRYLPIKKFTSGKIWKTYYEEHTVRLYIREDLYEQYKRLLGDNNGEL